MSIKVINQSMHKKMTDNHLAQVNFVALIPQKAWGTYNCYTSKRKSDGSYPITMGRIRFMEIINTWDEHNNIVRYGDNVLVFGRVSHGYGYSIEQDIENELA